MYIHEKLRTVDDVRTLYSEGKYENPINFSVSCFKFIIGLSNLNWERILFSTATIQKQSCYGKSERKTLA